MIKSGKDTENNPSFKIKTISKRYKEYFKTEYNNMKTKKINYNFRLSKISRPFVCLSLMSAFLLLTAFQCGKDWDDDVPDPNHVASTAHRGDWEYLSATARVISDSTDELGEEYNLGSYAPIRDISFDKIMTAVIEDKDDAAVYPPQYSELNFHYYRDYGSDTIYLVRDGWGYMVFYLQYADSVELKFNTVKYYDDYRELQSYNYRRKAS